MSLQSVVLGVASKLLEKSMSLAQSPYKNNPEVLQCAIFMRKQAEQLTDAADKATTGYRFISAKEKV